MVRILFKNSHFQISLNIRSSTLHSSHYCRKKILSRTKSDSAKSRAGPSGSSGGGITGASTLSGKAALPDFEEFLLRRDYTGARTLLEFQSLPGHSAEDVALWVAFCHFHLGDYARAMDQYVHIRDRAESTAAATMNGAGGGIVNEQAALNAAVCMFYLGMYAESQQLVERIPNSPLKVRLLFHLSHKLGDEERLMELHGSLRDVPEDQLSLAGLHYLRGHYQEAIDIYKRVQLDKK